jgi:hypothetical protein
MFTYRKAVATDFDGANNVHCTWMALTGRFPNSDHHWLVLIRPPTRLRVEAISEVASHEIDHYNVQENRMKVLNETTIMSLLHTASDQIHSHIRSRLSCCRRRRQQRATCRLRRLSGVVLSICENGRRMARRRIPARGMVRRIISAAGRNPYRASH